MSDPVQPVPSYSIRVNLRFGTGTDAHLWRELARIEPYARAKLVRKLMMEAWRARKTGSCAAGATPPAAPKANAAPTESGAQLAQDILGLLGGAVRL